MEKMKLRKPFFVVNPKSYLYGEEIYKLAKKTDELCEKYDFDCLFTAQLIDLPKIIADCPHLVPCAQFMESLKPGRGMGHVLPEALAAAGVKATFLNHAENPMTVHELAATIARANEVGILTVVCADSVEEGKAIAELHPDVMVCELTSLIGTGQVAGEDYMRGSTEAVKAVSPETQVLHPFWRQRLRRHQVRRRWHGRHLRHRCRRGPLRHAGRDVRGSGSRPHRLLQGGLSNDRL